MKDKTTPEPCTPDDLRLAAEARLGSASVTADSSEKMLHELQVHQAELEMQNEAMQRAETDLRTSRDAYLDLYEFAPVAYFTLDSAGTIVRLNLTGAELLGQPRAELIGRRLSAWVGPASRRVLADCLARIFAGQPLAPVELELPGSGANAGPRFAYLRARLDAGGQTCQMVLLDITDRKRAEGAVRQEQVFSQAVINSIPGIFHVLDENGFYRRWNATLSDTVLGPSDDQGIIQTRALDTIHPDDRERIGAHIAQIFATGEPVTTEGRMLLHGGPEYRWFLLNGQRLIMHGCPYLVGTGVDITETKAADEALCATSKKQAALLAALPDLLFRMDREGVIHEFRSQATDILYLTPDEFLGQKVRDVLPEPAAGIIMAALEEAATTGCHRGATYSLPMPQGELWYELSAARMDGSNPDNPEFIVLVRDITQRMAAETALRESEAQFKALADTSPLAIYLSRGPEESGNYVNPTFVRLFGYTLEEVPNAAGWFARVYPDAAYRRQVAAEWQDRVARAIATRTAIEPMETVVTCKDGSQRNVQWGYQGLGENNYSSGLDLTERRQAERGILALNQELEARVAERTGELAAQTATLIRTEARLRHAMEATRDGLWDWNLVTGELTLNDA